MGISQVFCPVRTHGNKCHFSSMQVKSSMYLVVHTLMDVLSAIAMVVIGLGKMHCGMPTVAVQRPFI